MKYITINLKDETNGIIVNKKSICLDLDKIIYILYERDCRVRKTDLFEDDYQRIQIMLMGNESITIMGKDAELKTITEVLGLKVESEVNLSEGVLK
jgi:hypothetical protein